MKENRLLFTNALIVLPTETIKGSLAVEDGKITGIFESGTELPGFTEVDVHGKALINVLQGGEASDIVIPAVWFDASNMDDPEISRILYD